MSLHDMSLGNNEQRSCDYYLSPFLGLDFTTIEVNPCNPIPAGSHHKCLYLLIVAGIHINQDFLPITLNRHVFHTRNPTLHSF